MQAERVHEGGLCEHLNGFVRILHVQDRDGRIADPVEHNSVHADRNRVSGEDLLRFDRERDQSQVDDVKGVDERNDVDRANGALLLQQPAKSQDHDPLVVLHKLHRQQNAERKDERTKQQRQQNENELAEFLKDRDWGEFSKLVQG